MTQTDSHRHPAGAHGERAPLDGGLSHPLDDLRDELMASIDRVRLLPEASPTFPQASPSIVGTPESALEGDSTRAAVAITVSVVMPALNEAANLPYVLPRIPSWVDEVLLVDGGSVDDTVEVARRLLPTISVIGQDRPGKGAALWAGFAAVRGDIIVTLDADGSTDPAELPAFVGCLLAGADFVKGSRFLQGGGTEDMGVVRRAGNWALRGAARTAFGGRYSDLCYGYNAFWRRFLPALAVRADGFEIETMLNVRALAAGMRVMEVPSYENRRIHGVSNLHTWRDGYRVLRTIARQRRRLGETRRGAPRDSCIGEGWSELCQPLMQQSGTTAIGVPGAGTLD